MSEQAPHIDNELLRRRLQRDEQANSHKRRYTRYATFVVARMSMVNSSSTIDGVINEISQGGLRFRPASRFMQRRDGDRVSMLIGDLVLSGRIRASRPDGYGVELLDMMSDETLASLVVGAPAH